MTITINEWREDANCFDFKGHRIAYWTNGSGRPLLLLHGVPTSSWDWTAIWDRMDGKKHRLIAADMLGLGFSDKPRDNYSIHRNVDLQLALLEHLGVTQYDILAHDYGVSVAQEMLARQREGSGAAGLGQVIFLNGALFPEQHRPPLLLRMTHTRLGPFISRILTRRQVENRWAKSFGWKTKPDQIDRDVFWALICERRGKPNLYNLLHYLDDRKEHERRWVSVLKNCQDRIGLINGAADPICGEHLFNRWSEYLPEARLSLLPDIGHYPQVEAPEQVAEIALQWLR